MGKIDGKTNGKKGTLGQPVCLFIWDKIFKNGPIKSVEDSLWKISSDMVPLGRPYHFKCFKGCIPQILLGPFLNTLSHL